MLQDQKLVKSVESRSHGSSRHPMCNITIHKKCLMTQSIMKARLNANAVYLSSLK